MSTSVLLQNTGGSPDIKTQIAVVTDSVSSPPSARVCGAIIYTIAKSCPPSVTSLSATTELTLDGATGIISVYTANIDTVGWHSVTVTATLTDYPYIQTSSNF